MSEEPLIVEQDGPIAMITMNRPERLNALDSDQIERLDEAWRRLGSDKSVRVIIFRSVGRAFCAGGDMSSKSDGDDANGPISDDDDPSDYYPSARRSGGTAGITARHCGIYKPVITVVQGVCAGAGLHFVADSEIVICSSDATFVDSHVNVGQVTALEPIGLSRRVPLGVVLRMVCMGRFERIDAARAYQIGMVTEVVASQADLLPRATELAGYVAQASPDTLRISLQAVWESLELPLSEAYLHGFAPLVRHRSHPDAIEGPLAFVEKRKPRWTVTL